MAFMQRIHAPTGGSGDARATNVAGMAEADLAGDGTRAVVRLLRHHCAARAEPDADAGGALARLVALGETLGLAPSASVALASLFELTEAVLGRALRAECCCARHLGNDERAVLRLLAAQLPVSQPGGTPDIPHGLPGALAWAVLSVRRLCPALPVSATLPAGRGCPFHAVPDDEPDADRATDAPTGSGSGWGSGAVPDTGLDKHSASASEKATGIVPGRAMGTKPDGASDAILHRIADTEPAKAMRPVLDGAFDAAPVDATGTDPGAATGARSDGETDAGPSTTPDTPNARLDGAATTPETRR